MHDGSLIIPIMRHNFSQSSFQGLGTSQPKSKRVFKFHHSKCIHFSGAKFHHSKWQHVSILYSVLVLKFHVGMCFICEFSSLKCCQKCPLFHGNWKFLRPKCCMLCSTTISFVNAADYMRKRYPVRKRPPVKTSPNLHSQNVPRPKRPQAKTPNSCVQINWTATKL